MLAIAAELEQELADVGGRLQENEEDGVWRECGDNRESRRVLQHGGYHGAASRRVPELVSSRKDRRDVGGYLVGSEVACRLPIDQQAVPPKNDSGVYAISLANRRHEVANRRHAWLPGKWLRS